MLTVLVIELYMVVGLLLSQALSVAYDKSKWWTIWLTILFWWAHVIFAIVGMLVELITWTYAKMFPKE